MKSFIMVQETKHQLSVMLLTEIMTSKKLTLSKFLPRNRKRWKNNNDLKHNLEFIFHLIMLKTTSPVKKQD